MYCFEELFNPEWSDDENSVEHKWSPSFAPMEHTLTGEADNLSRASTEHMLAGETNDLNVKSTEHMLTGEEHMDNLSKRMARRA
jgi:hypothetical protein